MRASVWALVVVGAAPCLGQEVSWEVRREGRVIGQEDVERTEVEGGGWRVASVAQLRVTDEPYRFEQILETDAGGELVDYRLESSVHVLDADPAEGGWRLHGTLTGNEVERRLGGEGPWFCVDRLVAAHVEVVCRAAVGRSEEARETPLEFLALTPQSLSSSPAVFEPGGAGPVLLRGEEALETRRGVLRLGVLAWEVVYDGGTGALYRFEASNEGLVWVRVGVRVPEPEVAFEERAVELGGCAGVLTVPRSPAAGAPGVVLIGGLGGGGGAAPGTALLEELAAALAERGVASVRWERASYAATQRLQRERSAEAAEALSALTVEEEFLAPAQAGVEVLSEVSGRVVVLGHELGALWAVEVEEVVGVVLVAPPGRRYDRVVREGWIAGQVAAGAERAGLDARADAVLAPLRQAEAGGLEPPWLFLGLGGALWRGVLARDLPEALRGDPRPVWVVWGEDDGWITRVDVDRVEGVLARREGVSGEVVRLEGVDHLLRDGAGRLSEAAVSGLVEWLSGLGE